MPKMAALTVLTSIHPLARTSRSGGSTSVIHPYLAGEYKAAPNPTTEKHTITLSPRIMPMHPPSLMRLAISITRCLGHRSDIKPIQGAKNTYDRVNMALSKGIHQLASPHSTRIAMAINNNALSANADIN